MNPCSIPDDRYTHNVFGIRLAVRYIQSFCGVSPLVPMELIKEIAESLQDNPSDLLVRWVLF